MKSYMSKLENQMQRIIIVFIMLAATTVAGNAQYFAEWSMGVSYQGGKVSNDGVSTDSPSYLTISVMPRVGYWLTDGVAVGACPTFILSKQKYPGSQSVEKSERTTQLWGGSVFGRYRLWEKGKLSVLAVSEINILGGAVKEKTGLDTNFSRSSSYIRINVYPAVSYTLTDKLSIIARWEFFNLSFTSETVKDKLTDSKVTFNNFGFSTRSDIIGRIGDFGIGFTYKF